MANNSLYNSSLANLYRSIGLKRGISPAFINASIAQGIAESSLDPNAIGDNGQARGLHQWHGPRQAGVDFANPSSQINHWYDENKANWGITDPVKANAAAIASERPAGWKPGDPTGVPSYNKRLGDTLALMRFQGYQQDPQDPKSFMALGSDSMPAVNTEQTQGAQSISLGNEEQQPFSNIGSTLANVGASIASLDNRGTGIASLNASRVASNLQQQEALRERENGWKYAGQTDNGQGLIFQRPDGQTRIEPIAPQFSGQKEPETIRTLRMLQADPSLLETKKEMSGDNGQDTVLTDEGVESAVEAKFAGRKDAYTGMTKKGRELAMNKEAEFKKKYGVTDEDIMSNQGKWAGVFGAEREYSKRIAMVGTAERSLSAAIEQGRGLLQDPEVKSMLNQPRLINQFNQMTAEQLNTEGLGKLAKLKENFETVAQDYTRVNAMGGSTTTVRAQDIARGILNTGMSDKAINELFDYMGQTGLRVKDALNAGQEELRTNARKHTRIEDYQKSQAASEKAIADRLDKDMVRFGLKPKETIRGSSSKGLPGVGQKTTINGVEIERLD